ncbi:TetR/AcrR family transcriptional regulator [Gorillibacterium sp. sgz500922]|uniref:TetR/AcrR family transcriptional regulator n=1 Tax=Gorillibacterium sp. sgz500922 TaxID=3446694 RepID=UPI003F67DF4B
MKKTSEPKEASTRTRGKRTTRAHGDDPYRHRILAAARELFAEDGLEAASMYGIAQRAGIGQGSLYRRYADKGEICSDLLRDSSDRFLTELETELLPPSAEHSPFARLLQAVDRILGFIERNAWLLLTIKAEFTGKHQLTQFEHPFFQRLHALLEDLLTQARDQGELSPVDPHFAATALIAVVSPDLYLYQQKVRGSGKDELAQGIRALLRGLRV